MLSKFNWITLLYTNLQEDAVLEIHYFKTRDQNSISRACFSFCLHSHSKVTFVCHVFALLWKTLFTMRCLFRKGMALLRFFMYVERGQFTQNQYWHHLIIFYDFLSSMEHTTRYFVRSEVTKWLPTFFKICSFVFCRRWKVIQIWNNIGLSKWSFIFERPIHLTFTVLHKALLTYFHCKAIDLLLVLLYQLLCHVIRSTTLGLYVVSLIYIIHPLVP